VLNCPPAEYNVVVPPLNTVAPVYVLIPERFNAPPTPQYVNAFACVPPLTTGTLMFVVPLPAKVNVLAVASPDAAKNTGLVLKESVAPPDNVLVSRRFALLFSKLFARPVFPTNSIEFVPSITPYQFVNTNGVCNAFAPVVNVAFADCNVPAAIFTIPPVCPDAINGCAAFITTVP
jgi:hypothetical protein